VLPTGARGLGNAAKPDLQRVHVQGQPTAEAGVVDQTAMDGPDLDEHLVQAARAGEAAAWEELVRRHHSPLVRFLSAQTGDPEAGSDLAQQTFLDAYRRLDRLTDGQPFAPWLYQIARYNFLPFWRRRRWDAHTSLDALAERAEEFLSAPRRPDPFAAVDEQDLVQQVLADLSPLLREALLLHALRGLTAGEIASMLGISESAAQRRVSRASADFRRRYRARSVDDAR